MRHATKKRAALNRVAAEWRHKFLLEIGRCERCNHAYLGHLSVHEITNSHARKHALMERAAVLVVCQYCHARFHRKGMAGKLEALAYLYHRRGYDFDLDKIHALRGDNWPELSEVMLEVKRIIEGERDES